MAQTPQDDVSILRRHGPALARFAGLIGVILLFGLLDIAKAADWKVGQMSWEQSTFFSAQNFRTVATQTVIVGIAAMGATCVIISAGIDLSVGSLLALTTVIVALTLNALTGGAGAEPTAAKIAVSAGIAAAAGVGVAAFGGFLNGTTATALRIPPFIATLGMMSIARGVAKWLAGSQTVLPDESTWLDEAMTIIPSGGMKWMVLAPGVWLMILVALAISVMLRKTVFGRHIFAIGSNEATARLCGLPVTRIKIQIYMLAGALTGLAGLMQFSRLTLGDPTVAIGLELDVIAAVVIGGGSLTGGEGSVSGTLIGAFILQFLRNGCNLIGVENYIQDIIVGLIIVVAVTVDQQRKRMAA